MSTSLAEQLARLAVPQTTSLTRDKTRPSLLFDPKEAANLDKETVYQIGIDGLDELKHRNPLFMQFENTLFHTTSKNFERSVESAEANQRLNRNVKKFLLQLSPYFLLNCSYKALEWLVHRYHVHEYNKEELLMLILPYHETNIFVRVLQLLNLKEPNDKWGWLMPLQKPGIHLPKQTLYNHAASDPYFIQFVSNFVLSILREHEKPSTLTVVFNFYCTVMTGALEYSQTVNEAQISQMLPVILPGLVSEVPDFTAATYVILAKLVTKTQLSNKVLEKFVEKVAQINVPNLKTEAVLLLVLLYQSQKQFKKISNASVLSLRQREGISKVIEQLNKEGIHIYPFLQPLMWSCINFIINKDNNDMYMDFTDSIIAEVKVDHTFVSILFSSVLDTYNPKRNYSKKTMTWLKEFMQKMERQYPVAYDEMIKKIMKPGEDPVRVKHQMILCKLIENLTNMQDGFEIFEKLYHPSSNIRIEGLRILNKKFDSLRNKDTEMLQNALTDRINDENWKVVRETLTSFNDKFSKIVDMNLLKNILIKLLAKCQHKREEWFKVSPAVLQVVCRHFDCSDTKIFLAVFPFLFPFNTQELQVSLQIIKSEIFGTTKLPHNLNNVSDSLLFFNSISSYFSKAENIPDISALIASLKEMPEEYDHAFNRYLTMMLLSYGLSENSDLEVAVLVLEIFEKFLSSSDTIKVIGETTKLNCMAVARKNRFPTQGFLKYVEIVITKTRQPPSKPNIIDFISDSVASKFYLRSLDVLMRNNDDPKLTFNSDTTQLFFDRFCNGNRVLQVEFLLNVAIAHPELRSMSMKFVQIIVIKDKRNLSPFLDFQQIAVPYILVGLTLPNEEMRQALIDIISVLIKAETSTNNSYVEFLKMLLKHREEILMDHEQMPLIMFNLLSPSGRNPYLGNVLEMLVKTCDNLNHPSYLKAGLVILLTHINDPNVYSTMANIAVEILNRTPSEINASEADILYKNIVRFNSLMAQVVTDDTPLWELVKLTIKNDTLLIKCSNTKQSCPSVLMLNQIERDVFSKLKPEMQGALLDLIIDVATHGQNPEVLQAAAHVFKHIDLDVALVLEHLRKMRDVQSSKQKPSTIKRRKSVLPTPDILDTVEWKKGTTVLENIQNKKKIRNATLLLPVLFDILKKCLDFDEQAIVEYTKQLLLSTILHCCDRMGDEPLPESSFNTQLVVQCVRASQNPQTHHHALLLLARAASLIPKQVLHHIIAIFTFVGSSVLRHDDAYSFQIISKIIDTIIPLLVENDSPESIARVLRVFVDAILDIPEHRRMPLFKQLLERLDANENLHIFVLLICEAHIVHGHTEKQKINRNRSLTNLDEAPKRLDVAADLTREFSPETVIVCCTRVLQYLRKLPEQKDDSGGNVDSYTFDIKRYNPKQFRHYKYTIITFVASLLSSAQFVNRVAALSDEEILKLEELFKRMIIDVLNYIQDTSKVTERNVNTPHAQYWKVMLHYSYDTLDAINALLTDQMFLLVIRGLMVYSLCTVRKRALELLNNKLQHSTTFINDCDKSKLNDLIVVPLINIIKTIESSDVEPEQELIVQKALFSLKLLVKNLAPEDPDKFVQILNFIADLVKRGTGKFHENILASLILCVAELCSTLRARAISCLNKFVPILIKLLKLHKNCETPSLLIVSDITAIHKILDSLPLFLSPYLEKLLYEMASCASKWNGNLDTDDPKLMPFITKLVSIQQKIGCIIPVRVLLPAVENSYRSLVEKRKYDAIGPLMAILSESLKNLKASDIQGNLPDLTSFFLNALQFRVDSQAKYEQANTVEEHIIKAFVSLVLKLSESTFRPLYYKLFDWAVRTDAKTDRVITFYNLSNAFANCLKGLFVLFAGHFLNNAATLLDACNILKNPDLYFEEESKNIILVENILKTLHTIFLYDSQKFVTKERFEVLMQPVVDQLENTLGGMESLENRSKNILTPCIVQFAVATADDGLWKQMNYQILLRTRHNSPNIRLIALECLSETAKKLGEDFLPLLPETIPFLAELLEDEEENVEKACQKTVQELEKVLGEPLQKYF